MILKKYQKEIQADLLKKYATVKPFYTEKEKEEAIQRFKVLERKKEIELIRYDNLFPIKKPELRIIHVRPDYFKTLKFVINIPRQLLP